MILSLRVILVSLALAAGGGNLALADHDQGLGKSQDGNDNTDLSSLSVAPEPSTYWMFLLGTLGIAWYTKRKYHNEH